MIILHFTTVVYCIYPFLPFTMLKNPIIVIP